MFHFQEFWNFVELWIGGLCCRVRNPLSAITKKFKRLANLEKENKFLLQNLPHFKWTSPLAKSYGRAQYGGGAPWKTWHKEGFRSTAGLDNYRRAPYNLPCLAVWYYLVLTLTALPCIGTLCICIAFYAVFTVLYVLYVCLVYSYCSSRCIYCTKHTTPNVESMSGDISGQEDKHLQPHKYARTYVLK